MNERVQRSKAYVIENAALGPGHAISLARAEWQRLQTLIADVSEEEAYAHPLPGEWSVSEVLQHLTLSHEGNVERIAILSKGDAYPGPPPVPGALPTEPPATFDAQRKQFLALIEQAVVVIEEADPAANLDLTSDHPAFGAYTWVEWATHMHFHARGHIAQIEQVRAAYAQLKDGAGK